MSSQTCTEQQPGAGSFPCLLCGATVFSSSGMQRHIQLFHASASGGLWDSDSESWYACIFCDFATSSELELQSHVDKEHSEQYACPLCGSTFGSANGVLIHMAENHPEGDTAEEGERGCQGEAGMSACRDVTGEEHIPETDLTNSDHAGSLESDCAHDKVSLCTVNGSAEILETSLRLNDCPFGGSPDPDKNYDEEDEVEDVSENMDTDEPKVGDVNGNAWSGEKSDLAGEDVDSDSSSNEESNLAVILGSSRGDRNQGKSTTSVSDNDSSPVKPAKVLGDKNTDKSKTSVPNSTPVKPTKIQGTGKNPEKCDISFSDSSPVKPPRVLGDKNSARPNTSGPESSPMECTKGDHGGARPKVKVSTSAASLTGREISGEKENAGTAAPLCNGMGDETHNGTDAAEVIDLEEMYSDPDVGYNCPLCLFHTLSEVEIQRHVSREHMMDEGEEHLVLYTCPFCAGGFDTPNDLSRHINADHPDGEVGGGSGSHDRSGVHEEWVPQPAAAGGSRQGAACLKCPVCELVMTDGNADALNEHVSSHFQSFLPSQGDTDRDRQMAMRLQQEEQRQQQKEHQQFQQVQTEYGMDKTMTAKQQFEKDLDQAVSKGQLTASQYHQKKIAQGQSSRSGQDDGSTQVPGVLEKLRSFYDSKACPRTVAKVYLSNSTHHYSSSYGDKGWGCGYRNFQMLLSCLMNEQTYLRVLFGGQARMPSVEKLQQLIESAWQKGFDPQGRQQLGGKVVNTRTWIGATEIVATLSSLRIKCQLLDFALPSGPDNTHPALIGWVRDYFTSAKPFKPPLYLQHQGHSRTIVGIEELRNGNVNLLLFDPGVPKERMRQFHGNINYNLLQTVRKTLNAFRAKQYQIVAVTGVMDDQEFRRSKTVRSTRMS